MKTVIVFDTEDDRGMNDAHAIMSHLCREYLEKRLPKKNTVAFSKIPLIKLFREYGTLIKDGLADNGLKSAKNYTDKVFRDHNRGGLG
jgi:hypothetical protein